MFWCLGKYDMDYVKEDGEWKFLKLVYRTVYNSSFINGSAEQAAITFLNNPDFLPDKPSTFHLPYAPNRICIIPPAPPEPFED